MTNTFRTYPNRLDARTVCFASDEAGALLKEICCNPYTAVVRAVREGGPVTVPAFEAERVAAHLVKNGWSRA